MSAEQAKEQFRHERIARLATADADAVPHIVPVTFTLTDDELCFAIDHKPKSTMRLRRLRNIEQNPAVSVLVDRYDEDWSRLWWARADGTADVLNEEDHGEQRARSVDALAAEYRQYLRRPPAGPVVRITVVRWSGWMA